MILMKKWLPTFNIASRIICINENEWNKLNNLGKELLLLHESLHKNSFNKKEAERQTQKKVTKILMSNGYSFKDILFEELNYRLIQKYGLSLDDYIEYMSNA